LGLKKKLRNEKHNRSGAVFAESWEVGGEEKTVYGQVEEAALTGLKPATLYHIRLFAENELGRSKEGRVIKVFPEQPYIFEPKTNICKRL